MPIDYSQSPSQSLDDAAQTALTRAWKCSENRRECGGVIYEAAHIDGNVWYFASPLETSNKPFGVEITALSEPPPRNMRIVADYHVHICSVHNAPFAPFFSVPDTLVDQGFHITGYILDGCSGNVYRYDPRQDPSEDEEIDFKSGKVIYLTTGHLAGWINIRSSHK